MKIQKFMLLETGRAEGASIIANSGIDKATAEELLITALPSGSPTDKFYKMFKKNGEIYLGVLHLHPKVDKGLSIIIEMNENLFEKNPVSLANGIYSLLKEIIDQEEIVFPDGITIKTKEFIPVFNDYKDFESLIFSIFTEQKTVIVGDPDELENFWGTIFECIPNQLRGFVQFVANMATIAHDEQISLVPVSDRVLKALDARKEDYTVLMLPLRTTYGQYSSTATKRIAKFFSEKKKESIKEEITHLFTLATESKELVNIADFAAEHKLEIADASLILWIRANHYDLQMEKSILEELGN